MSFGRADLEAPSCQRRYFVSVLVICHLHRQRPTPSFYSVSRLPGMSRYIPTCGLISIVPNKPTAKSSATAASKPVPAAAMIPVLSVAPAPQTTATTPLSITTSTETSRQYPRGQRRQSNLGRVWQRRFGGNRCRNFPEDHRHSVAGSSGRISTRFRKWSGLRQSPQVTYDRSCGSPIRKAGVNLVHHDRRRQFPNGARPR
jgi:hypothetical protein